MTIFNCLKYDSWIAFHCCCILFLFSYAALLQKTQCRVRRAIDIIIEQWTKKPEMGEKTKCTPSFSTGSLTSCGNGR